jgi:hypothetical protein
MIGYYKVKDIFFGRIVKITGISKTEKGTQLITEPASYLMSWCVLLKKNGINEFEQLTLANKYKITSKEKAIVGDYIIDEKTVAPLYPILIDKSRKYISQKDIEVFHDEIWKALNNQTSENTDKFEEQL